jgi:hypothetical protein
VGANVSNGYEVDPAALVRLQRDVEIAGEQLAGALAAFQGGASDVGRAFGLLGPSDEVYREYQGAVRDAVDVQRAIADTLIDVAGGLGSSAANYRGASTTSVQPGP